MMAAIDGTPSGLPVRLRFWATAAFLSPAVVLAGLYAYYVIFSSFAFYDDEGFLDISLRHFIQGRPIYDDVFTQYGPFFYLFNGAIFRLTSVPVDSDSMRVLVTGIWLASASLAALCTIRVSGAVPLGVAVLALTTVHLRVLANEPGHPQALGVLLLLSLPATATFLTDGRRALVCGVLGTLVGLLVMTKINVGVFALLALALTLSSAIRGRLAMSIRVSMSLAVVALPALLMRAHIEHGWTSNYAWFATLIAIPVVVLHWTERPMADLRLRDGVWAAIGCAGAIVASCAAVAIHGTSLRELVMGPLEQALKFPLIRRAPVLISANSLALARGVIALVVAMLLARRWWPERLLWERALAGIKIAYGTFALYAVYANRPGTMRPGVGTYASDPGALFHVALPFVGLAMIPSAALPAEPRHRFTRALLCSLAVVNSLQAYPVAGSQLTFATVLVIVVAALCLGDGLSSVTDALPRPLRGHWPRMAAGGLAVTVLLLMQWGLMRAVREQYDSLVPLDLPGARRLRMREEQVALYRWLSLNLQAHADTFIGMPALNSLYFWSEKEPPTALNPNSWMLLLDDAQQRRVVDSLSRHPQACAVVVPRLNQFWLHGRPMTDQPLARYITDEFQTVSAFLGYEFLVRKGRSAPDLIYCARRQELPGVGDQPTSWLARMSLPVMKGRAVFRVTVVDLRSGRTLADTEPAPSVAPLTVSVERVDRGEAPAPLTPDGLGLNSSRSLVLRSSSPIPSAMQDHLIIRLFDERNGVFASLPVVS